MARLNIDRQKNLEPKRLVETRREIERLGYTITFQNERELQFMFNGHLVKFFPYTGWHTGKSIQDGRGFENLVKQIKL
mgnify:CR=1 FL=1